ncbi:MAG: hypothetical protein D6732_10485 [Methanobacteriota archaeon]|nr:MAG: hypothetical protein D6732_10485 [Euryarchaeota archaeon]
MIFCRGLTRINADRTDQKTIPFIFLGKNQRFFAKIQVAFIARQQKSQRLFMKLLRKITPRLITNFIYPFENRLSQLLVFELH